MNFYLVLYLPPNKTAFFDSSSCTLYWPGPGVSFLGGLRLLLANEIDFSRLDDSLDWFKNSGPWSAASWWWNRLDFENVTSRFVNFVIKVRFRTQTNYRGRIQGLRFLGSFRFYICLEWWSFVTEFRSDCGWFHSIEEIINCWNHFLHAFFVYRWFNYGWSYEYL